MVRDKYEQILNQFQLYYPSLYTQTIDWWATGPMSITVKLKDKSRFEYNYMDNTIRAIKTEATSNDDVIAKSFGYNLQKFIPLSGKTQNEIAQTLGITNAMLSRYVHGTSMPSAGKAFRLAKILGCSVDELFDNTYEE